MTERRSRSTRTSSRRRLQERRSRQSQRRLDLQGVVDALVNAVRSHMVATVITAIVAALIIGIYGPLRSYYVAVRSGQDLQAHYDALVEQNESLRDDLGRLQSEEGIEDEAHRRGYVKDGETGVVTEGLPKEDTTALLGEIEIEDTRPWYIRVLDVVFFYSSENWQ